MPTSNYAISRGVGPVKNPIITFSPFSPYATPPLDTTNLSCYLDYPDYTGSPWVDRMGNYNATVVGTIAPPGPLDLVGGNLVLGQISQLDGSSTEFTIAMWIRNREMGNTRTLWSYDNDEVLTGIGGESYMLYLTSTNEMQYVGVGGTNFPAGTQSNYQQIVVVQKTTSVDFYINGSFIKNSPITNPVGGAGYTFRVGAAENVAPWFGDVGQILIYSRALSSSQVFDIFNATRGSYSV